MNTVRPGRPAATSRARLEQVALGLFLERGFDETTVDDVAEAAGIGRRTFFRYYPSKNDVVWGDFEAGLAAFADQLAQTPEQTPVFTAVREAVLAFNALDPSEEDRHRLRMELVLHVPALQAHSTLRYAAWREVVASYVAVRLGRTTDEALPQLVAHLSLAAALAGYEQWLARPGADLQELLDVALRQVEAGLTAL